MKLSKKAEQQIKTAIGQMQEAIDFIRDNQTRVVRITSVATLPDSAWKSGTGLTGIAIEKEVGSKLCQLYNAKQTLDRMIDPTEGS